jgi:hypothetical protein
VVEGGVLASVVDEKMREGERERVGGKCNA